MFYVHGIQIGLIASLNRTVRLNWTQVKIASVTEMDMWSKDWSKDCGEK